MNQKCFEKELCLFAAEFQCLYPMEGLEKNLKSFNHLQTLLVKISGTKTVICYLRDIEYINV